MAALTADIKITRYGTADGHQPIAQPLGGSATVYRGSVGATRSGYLVAMSTPQSTDVVWGVIENSTEIAFTGPGITNPASTNGGVAVTLSTGTFILANGTAGDALAQTDVGSTVYLIDEQTVGKTTGSGTRPVAGVLMQTPTGDPTMATGKVAVKVGNAAGNTSP
jgi:hypothetical protein